MNLKLKSITRGSEIIDQIFHELLIILKSGKPQTEIQIANQIKRLGKKFGGSGMAFPPIVSTGSGSSEIHHKPSKKKIEKNNFLMLDYGVKISGFCSDFTRTLFIGRPNKLHEKIYNLVLRSQLTGIRKIKIGTAADEIDFATRHIINQSGLGKFFSHGSGHGVTKKIHDKPSFKPNSGDIVSRGDIVTIEPGIYFPKKYGIRIEDMVYVSDKPTIFSKVPKDFQNIIVK